MIDGRLLLPMSPLTTSTLPPNARLTAVAVLYGFLPLRLALVETKGAAKARHSLAATGWRIILIPMV